MGIDQSYVQLIHNKPVQAGPRLVLLVLVAGAHVAAAVALFLGPALQTLQREAPEPLSVQLFEEARQTAPPAQPATAKASQANRPQPKLPSTATANVATASQATPTPSVQPSPAAAAPTPPSAAPASPATREVPAASPAPASSPSAGTAAATVRTAVNIDAAYAGSNPKPPYPPMARRLGEEGTVTLRILVTSDGLASKVEIKKSSGSSLLDKSAEQTIKQWRFIPAKLDGKAVEEWYETRWTFKLEG